MSKVRIDQVAASVPFDNTGLPASFAGVDNVRDAIVAAFSPPIETLTEFESFGSAGLETTTSNSLVVKSGYPYTTSVKSVGTYAIDYTAQVGQGNNNQLSRIVVDWRLGTSGAWTTLLDTEQELRDVGFAPWSGFSLVTVPSAQVFQVRIQYANPGSGACRIQEANIKIGKVSN
jgi:hypothetical protein